MKDLIKQFLSDSDGFLSSKRLGFLSALVTSIVLTITTTGFLLKQGQYQLAVDLINTNWIAAFGFAGLVATDLLKVFKKKK